MTMLGRYMGKLAINTTMLTVALTVAFSLVAFFSNSWFNNVNATSVDFQMHQREQATLIAKLQTTDSLLEQRETVLEKRLESMDMKLDRLLERR